MLGGERLLEERNLDEPEGAGGRGGVGDVESGAVESRAT